MVESFDADFLVTRPGLQREIAENGCDSSVGGKRGNRGLTTQFTYGGRFGVSAGPSMKHHLLNNVLP